MNLRKPAFWDLPKPNFISYLLVPFSLPIIFKNYLSQFLKKKHSSHIKTICIGNIYLGGTGKTPLTIKTYEILKKLGSRVATVKKAHSNERDEQLLLKKKTSLIINNYRKDAIIEGLNQNYDVLVFDDGLQEIKIDYDIKIVCFKTKNWIGNGKIIPAGPMRENISSLKKFDAVFLNGNSNNIEKIENQINKINSKIKIFRTLYKIRNIQNFDLNKKYLIFSGIGNPADFKNMLLENNFKIVKELIFPDHYEYNLRDFEKIQNYAQNEKLNIITTEKDYVKIPEFFRKQINFITIDLVIQNENEFINLIKK